MFVLVVRVWKNVPIREKPPGTWGPVQAQVLLQARIRYLWRSCWVHEKQNWYTYGKKYLRNGENYRNRNHVMNRLWKENDDVANETFLLFFLIIEKSYFDEITRTDLNFVLPVKIVIEKIYVSYEDEIKMVPVTPGDENDVVWKLTPSAFQRRHSRLWALRIRSGPKK